MWVLLRDVLSTLRLGMRVGRYLSYLDVLASNERKVHGNGGLGHDDKWVPDRQFIKGPSDDTLY